MFSPSIMSATSSQPPSAQFETKVRRRRAKLVCLRCNQKKIRCDLEQRSSDEGPCMNCALANADCKLRTSNRNLHRRRKVEMTVQSNSGIVKSPDRSAQSLGTSVDAAALPTMQSLDTALLEPTNQSVPFDSHRHSPYAPASLPMHAQILQQSPAQLASQDQITELYGHVPISHDPLEDWADNEDPQTASKAQASYLGESGYMTVFSQPRPLAKAQITEPLTVNIQCTISPLMPTVYMSYADAFFQNCHCFCPVLDRSMLELPEFSGSLLLQQALALVGSVVQPSLVFCDSPSLHYENARMLLHLGMESHPLASLVSVMLFYWWNTCPPNIVSMNGPWWWTGIAIRQAQELGLHHEIRTNFQLQSGKSIGLRRRIWWTLFARERLTSICQGRPCIINPSDCDVRDPSPDDFPDSSDPRAHVFVQWVRLCSIVGQVAEHLRQQPPRPDTSKILLDDLTSWVHELPQSLQLPFSKFPTENFDRAVLQLHLPYLSCITLLNLEKSQGSVPIAYPLAVLAASCTARIFEDFLARGSLKFLQGMAGWHISIALLALLHARQVSGLEDAANQPFDILRAALKEMAKQWPSARMYDQGVDKLLASQRRHEQQKQNQPPFEIDEDLAMAGLHNHPTAARTNSTASPQNLERPSPSTVTSSVNTINDLARYFPGTTRSTSRLFDILLSSAQEPTSFHESEGGKTNDLGMLLFDFFDNPFALDVGVKDNQNTGLPYA